MNSPQPETKITSRVVFSFIYSAASIKAAGWGGVSLTAGIAETAMMVLSIYTTAASLLLKRRRARSPKVSEVAG